MKKTLFLFLFSLLSLLSFAQLNMTLLDQIDYTQNTNDIWGWVDPDDGTEYALVGTVTGVSVVSLADPQNIVEVAFLPGANSTWRDIKTWGNYAYVTNETSGGLMVIDLTGAPGNITATNWTPSAPGMDFTKAHNLYIDEFGYCYIAGANKNSGGMIILDVFSTPGSPQFVAAAPAVYAHDVYVRDNKMYASEIYLGRLGIYDVSDKMNIPLLAAQQTPYSFTHNAWLNDAGDVVFTTDEKANAPIGAYDISDLDNIIELDQFRPVATLGANVIPHNVHVWEDWLIISYYTDGGVIVDASKPDNLIEVGNWDTFLGGNGGFNGAWGAYPFLPSGLVLLTDIGNGLFVCGANYVRACWLEGTVTDAVTGLPVSGASVHIESTQANTATTNLSGVYKTGQAIPGDFEVTFSATGYYPKTVNATLENGVLTILNVALEPISSFLVSGQVVKASDGTPVPGAKIILQNAQGEYTFTADANGNFSASNVLGGNYTLVAVSWGYLYTVVNDFDVNLNTQPIVVSLKKGYQDDFILDQGWTNTHTASSGWWVRDEPIGTNYNGITSNPDLDVDFDLGNKCFVTGNGGGDAGTDDVDNGVVTLTSPVMNLSTFNKPVLRYSTWFFNAGGNGTPNDALEVRISNGTDEVVLETITQSAGAWKAPSEFDLASLITLTDNMQVIFETGDLPNSGHLVEAAVDAFLVEDTSPYPLFSASQTVGCGPLTVQFSDASDSTSVWVWTFEGGNPAASNDQNPVVVYDTPGTYTVTLNVITNDGNQYAIEQPNLIAVLPAPTAGFTYNISGGNVSFTNTSQSGNTYQWNFGDNATSAAQNPSHNYPNPGIYTVTLTVTNDCGSNTFSQDILILDVPPTADFFSTITSGCAPLTVQFTDQSQGGPNTWAWSFPGGSPATSGDQNPVVVYSTPGVYSVSLTVSNGAGSDDVVVSQLITVGEEPTANFTYNIAGSQVSFTNASGNATSYTWDFGDNSGSAQANPVHTYAQGGEFQVTLTAMNDCGIAVYTETVNVELSGVADPDEMKYRLSASPNPFAGQVTVRYEMSETFSDASLLVFNVLGEQIATVPLQQTNGTLTLDRAFNGSGVYFIRLMVDGKVGKSLRVVKI